MNSNSITFQNSPALMALLVEVWDNYLEYLTTHTSDALDNQIRKV